MRGWGAANTSDSRSGEKILAFSALSAVWVVQITEARWRLREVASVVRG